MKRNQILLIHIIATIVAMITISTFFIVSLRAEIIADEALIKATKTAILYGLPILLIVMPTLAISGKKLAGKSKSLLVLKKLKRMNWIMVNGILLISLAIYLYYRATYIAIDPIFLFAQITEFIFGIANLTLISLNVKSGLQLSGKMKK